MQNKFNRKDIDRVPFDMGQNVYWQSTSEFPATKAVKEWYGEISNPGKYYKASRGTAERERSRERESMCVVCVVCVVCVRERERVSECACVCERERER
jgi:hypothetical protein